MAGQLKLRRGTTSQLANYIGSEGELTYDTVLKSLVLHDGVTLGGVKIPYLSNDLVPSTMLPTATELVVGASKIATTAIAQAGTNDTDFITAKKLSSTRQSKWENKTGMFFGTTYLNSSSYERDVSVLSELITNLIVTSKVTFINLTTLVETVVYFGSSSNFTSSIRCANTFTVPANTSYKVEVVTYTLQPVSTTVFLWSERNYV